MTPPGAATPAIRTEGAAGSVAPGHALATRPALGPGPDDVRRRLGRLHVLVDAEELAAAALDGGAPTIQARLKSGTDAERCATAAAIAARCRAAGALCLVNDRADIAVAVGADGVHLGADDLPVAAARRVVGPAAVVGGTARDPVTARRLVAEGASYLGVGPTYATSSKVGLPAPLGLDGLRAVAAAVDVPVVAIAGITAARVPAVLAAGAFAVAVIGAVAGAGDPRDATRQLYAAVTSAVAALGAAAGRAGAAAPAGGPA
jgi:thiamine-phosphate pyrophosphorylase